MKIHLQTTIPWHRIMKVTFSQLLLALIITNVSYSRSLSAPEVNRTSSLGETRVENASHEVTGKVTDKKGEPLIGVTVKLKGSKSATTTDANGKYKLNIPNDNGILVFTYIGFDPQEITIGGRSVIDVVLKGNAQSLNEVVVVGYTTQTKATITGAVEVVTAKTFEDRAITNVGLALQGATPGLVVTRTSSRPGNEGLKFQIRGATSVNGGDPLIVIDGVPALNYYQFQNMNTDDIETITILKDAEAAIYGAKAANGVILVTTKIGKGRNGKAQVNYSGNMRFTTNGITAFSPTMSQYATMWIEANKEEAIPNWWGWVSLDNMQKMQQGIEGVYHTQYWGDVFLGNANRIDEMFAQRYSYQHNLSIANSTDASNYRLSLEYADNKGNLATAYDGQKQYDLRFNYNYKVSDRVKLGTNFSIINAYTSSPSVGLDASLYGQEQPFYPAKNPYGQWYADYGTVGDRQPVAATSDGGRDNRNDLTTRLDLKATVNLLKGLDFEGLASFSDERYNQQRWVNLVQTYDWYGNPAQKTVTATQVSAGNPGYSTVANDYFSQYYLATLKYNKSFGLHNFSVAAGIEATKWNSQLQSASRLNFTDLGVYDLNAADPTVAYTGGGKQQNGSYSYIARFGYNYAEKYLIDFVGRDDGASQFDTGFKFKQFGSVKVGWVFSKEDFLKGITSVLDFGKIRASYGVSGNNVGIGNYDYTSTVNSGTVVLGSPAVLTPSSSLAANGLISNQRTWERVSQKNIGIDLGFFKSRLTTTFDYFIKDNDGMLINVNYPSVLGGSAPKTNSGQLNVKGWEVKVNWQNRNGGFTYNIGFNIQNTNTLLQRLDGADGYGAGKNGTINGYPLNSWFLHQTAGYFQSQAEVDAYYAKYAAGNGLLSALSATNSAVALRPGDTKIVDLNGDGILTDAGGNINGNTSDLKFMGDGDAHYVFGINLGGTWKGFDVTAFFQGTGSQLIMRNGWMAYPFNTVFTNQNANFLGQTWTATQTDALFPRLTVNPARAGWNYANNDFMLQNSRYIRLKTLVVGYTIPQSIIKKVGLEKLRVYFSGNDLWEKTSIKDGFDPEMGETGQNAGYPFYRTMSLGLQVGF